MQLPNYIQPYDQEFVNKHPQLKDRQYMIAKLNEMRKVLVSLTSIKQELQNAAWGCTLTDNYEAGAEVRAAIADVDSALEKVNETRAKLQKSEEQKYNTSYS